MDSNLFPDYGFDFSAWEFESELDSVIVPTFKAAYERLDAWQKEAEIEFQSLTDEQEISMAYSEFDFQDSMQRSRNRAIGAGALNWISSAMNSELTRLERHLEKGICAKPVSEKNQESWITKTQTRFKEKFSIDFDNASVSFELVREIYLARNALIHFDDPGAFDRYTKAISNPRFVADDYSEMFVRFENFLASAKDSKRFIRWVFGEAKKLHSSKEGIS